MADPVMIPYFVHEGEMTRAERLNKRLWILILILVVALIGSNAGWIIYESQYQTEVYTEESYEATADGGSNAILNGSGEVNVYGGKGHVQEGDGSAEGQGQ